MAKMSHFDQDGKSRMVDIRDKEITYRQAIASGLVRCKRDTLLMIHDRAVSKGDVLELARIAGIMGAKKTSDIIPLCHPVCLTSIQIEYDFPSDTEIRVVATVCGMDRTGVEMEALTAVSIAALTIYDMCKSVDREICISEIQLDKKTGGKSGDFIRQRGELVK